MTIKADKAKAKAEAEAKAEAKDEAKEAEQTAKKSAAVKLAGTKQKIKKQAATDNPPSYRVAKPTLRVSASRPSSRRTSSTSPSRPRRWQRS